MQAAKDGVDARDQLTDRERLGDVVVGAGIERGHLVLFGIAHRKNDHRNVRAGTDGTAGFQASHAGHVHIQNDQVKADLLTVDGERRTPQDVYRKVSAVKLSVLAGSEKKK